MFSKDAIEAISKVSTSACISGDSISTLSYLATKADYVEASPSANSVGRIAEKERMPNNAKTLLHKPKNSNGLYIKIADKDGYVDRDKYLMQDIVDVSTIANNGQDRVVVVTFSDGSKEKAVLLENDQFNLEDGISICIAKKTFSNMVGRQHGSSVYNKMVERGVKVYKRKVKEAEKKAAEEAAKKEKYKKIVAKKQAKRKARVAEERENQIEIQKEAYLRAMHEYNTRSAD